MFKLDDGAIYKTSTAVFDGQNAMVRTRFSSAGVPIESTFTALQNHLLKNLGSVSYDSQGAVAATSVTKQIPGVAEDLGTEESTSYSWEQVTTQAGKPPGSAPTMTGEDTVTFMDLDNMTLAGKTLSSVCKVKYDITAKLAGGVQSAQIHQIIWFASGYGWVKVVSLNDDGSVDPSRSVAVSEFLTSPP